jgi:hypothetical protein
LHNAVAYGHGSNCRKCANCMMLAVIITFSTPTSKKWVVDHSGAHKETLPLSPAAVKLGESNVCQISWDTLCHLH